MRRHFNTAGPCKPENHYMVAPEARIPAVRSRIESQSYFVLHAPRQVGKTTALTALAESLTREGQYAAVVVSMETGAAFRTDIGAAEEAILDDWLRSIRAQLPGDLQPHRFAHAAAGSRIGEALATWAQNSARPLVVFLDEIDSLQDDVLLSVLRQLRSGHQRRPKEFPWSLALVGMRDVRDYKVASGSSDRLHSASPFNVKTDSLTMQNFTAVEVAQLYAQHTEATGQVFEPAAIALAYQLTGGQPWLVNALARQLVDVVQIGSEAITPVNVLRARDILIERQDTHLDSLAERLRDPRVRSIIEPMIQGETLRDLPLDDLRYVEDLGLTRQDTDGSIEIANPIYREIVAKMLAAVVRASMPKIQPSWLNLDLSVDWDQTARCLCRVLVDARRAAHEGFAV